MNIFDEVGATMIMSFRVGDCIRQFIQSIQITNN